MSSLSILSKQRVQERPRSKCRNKRRLNCCSENNSPVFVSESGYGPALCPPLSCILCFLFGAVLSIHNELHDKLLDVFPCRSEILARVKVVGMLGKVFTDRSSHYETKVGVDVDLADRASCCLAEHVFRDADGIGHLAAVGVDLIDILLDDRGRTVQDDREVGKKLFDLLEYVEAKASWRTCVPWLSDPSGVDARDSRTLRLPTSGEASSDTFTASRCRPGSRYISPPVTWAY